ncbi:hypothetical protein [uncultured Aquimarina sp.]|uniref:hypothetical protein n=1 Tax=uncultured Aquimarina sp. TaxID=575652 RepID=UPI0026105092|nr:hypothetical protein [uncultured Aquimarina sp.]
MKNLFFAFAFLFSTFFMTTAATELNAIENETCVEQTVEEEDICILIIETDTEVLIAVFEC